MAFCTRSRINRAWLAGLTKWSGQAKSVEEIPALVRAAMGELESGRPRPVAIEIPPEVLAARGDLSPIAPPLSQDGRLRPDARDVEIAAALLDAARFPVIYVGGGVLAANAAPELRALAEKLDAPVVASENGRGGLSDHHSLSLNAVGGHAVFPHADVALIVGSRFMNMSTGNVLLPPSRIKYIYLNVDESAWSAPRPSGATIHADAKLGLAALADAVRRRPAKRAADVARVRAWVADQTARIAPQMAWVRALRAGIPEDGVLVSELTQVGYVAGVHYPVYEPQTYIGHGYQGTLGYGFPTSLGVAAGNPDRAVVSITGDGGFGWAMQELSTAARYRLNVAIVVFNDGAFGNVRTLQEQQFGASFADEVYNPKFDMLAAAFDVRYARVERPESLPSALMRAFAEGGPTLIEAPVGPMPNPWSLIRLSHPPAGFSAPPNPLGDSAATA